MFMSQFEIAYVCYQKLEILLYYDKSLEFPQLQNVLELLPEKLIVIEGCHFHVV